MGLGVVILVFTSRPPLLWWLHSGEGWMVKFCFLKFSLPFLKILFILFLTVLGLCCCVQAFSSCSMPSVSPRWVLSLHSTGCRACRLQLLCSMWNLPGPEIEFVSPALAFLTTGQPGKSATKVLMITSFSVRLAWDCFKALSKP